MNCLLIQLILWLLDKVSQVRIALSLLVHRHAQTELLLLHRHCLYMGTLAFGRRNTIGSQEELYCIEYRWLGDLDGEFSIVSLLSCIQFIKRYLLKYISLVTPLMGVWNCRCTRKEEIGLDTWKIAKEDAIIYHGTHRGGKISVSQS